MRSGGLKKGFALLTVMLGLSVLAVLIGTSVRTVSAHVHLIAHESRQAREMALFRAGLEHAASIALASLEEGAPSLDEEPIALAVGPDQIFVAVRDVGGLIDLNAAPIDLIARLFEVLQLDPNIAARLAAAREAGYRYQTVAELDGLIDAEGIAAVRPFMTVHSGRAGIDPAAAPPAILEHLAGRPGTRASHADMLPDSWRAPRTRRTFRVSVRTVTLDGPPREAVIAVRGGAEPTNRVLAIR